MPNGIITILDETDKSALETKMDGHIADTNNPHGVTASQIGASSLKHASQHATGGDDAITPADIGALSKNGDTMTGVLNFQKHNNGSGWVNKNHSSTADYGMQIRDVSASDQVATLSVCGAAQKATLTLRNGPDDSAVVHELYHTGNQPEASEIQPGAFSGKMLAQYTAASDVTAAQIRNIYAGTAAMTSGVTKLTSGYIYLQYK